MSDSQPVQLPYPLLCNHWPVFETQNEARTLIVLYQKAGHIKHCDHAIVGAAGSGYGGAKRYRPECAKDSMIVMANVDPRLYRESHAFYGCPKVCHYYSPALRTSLSRHLRAASRALIAPVVGFPQWFASLAASVQLMIGASLLVIVLGAFAPRLLAAVTEFIKALK